MKYTEQHIPAGLTLRVYYSHNQGTTNKHAAHLVGYFSLSKSIRKRTDWYTRAVLLDSNGADVAQGVAECSHRDNPSKKIGRAIAVGRALKSYEEAHG